MSHFLKLSMMILMATSLFVATGCSSTSKKGEVKSNYVKGSEKNADVEVNSDSDSGNAGPLRTVNFGYDSSRLSSDARTILKDNANFLKDNSGIEIQVEGHCDERGGVQYNLALGERRAKAVKDYLVALGVQSKRISTISFGKERPVAFGHDEEAWGQNRRANFVVTGN